MKLGEKKKSNRILKFHTSSFIRRLKLGLQNFGSTINFTISTKLQNSQIIEFYLSANLGGQSLLVSVPMIFADQVFNASFQRQNNNHNWSLSNGYKLIIQIKQINNNVEPSKKNLTNSKKSLNPSKLSALLNNPEFSDFKFIVNENEFDVHKCVLANASEAFVKIFRVNKSFWKINDINEHIFGILLRFIYCDEVPENLGNIAVKLFEAADVFKIEELKEICSRKIHETLAAENSLELYNWAYVYDLEVLKMKSWELVKK